MEPHPRGDYVHWDDYESLRALNAELVAAVQRVTSYCDFCGGTGKIFHTLDPNGPFQRCPHCGDLNDLRALIAREKGEP
jgi:rRNA maturation endonuclease Nob1